MGHNLMNEILAFLLQNYIIFALILLFICFLVFTAIYFTYLFISERQIRRKINSMKSFHKLYIQASAVSARVKPYPKPREVFERKTSIPNMFLQDLQ
ncbi:Oidioi.mRNA.OKI2018_I69.chr1.g81.t1.cds [Oikopleura dioica]|uniref:Oidioi.mRNA.OKI2018_I69.chr1.g81.t1.cds n=1 Tax=Oikopleura dioica TaxID=34765 RepID=A0ABN7SIQ9_OIKDI|nr:Oidioi.mRNA.OKI2018_I69.chr1.g81.t1.cds [Oikopleura dioica]